MSSQSPEKKKNNQVCVETHFCNSNSLQYFRQAKAQATYTLIWLPHLWARLTWLLVKSTTTNRTIGTATVYNLVFLQELHPIRLYLPQTTLLHEGGGGVSQIKLPCGCARRGCRSYICISRSTSTLWFHHSGRKKGSCQKRSFRIDAL